MVPTMQLSLRIRAVIFLLILIAIWLAYLLPWWVDSTIVLGLLIGWGIEKLLESLS